MPIEDDATTLYSASSRRSSITVLSDAASSIFSSSDLRLSNWPIPASGRRRSSQLGNTLRRLSSANSLTSVLFDAAERGDLPTLQTYLGGASLEHIHRTTKDDISLLHVAAAANHAPVVLYLLSRGMSACTRTKRQDREPLYLAAQHNSLESAAILIDRGRAAVSASSKHDGATALHKAAIEGHEDMIRLLLTAGADVDVQDLEGLRPLNWALQASRLPIVRLLLDNGASVKIRTHKGFTVLQRAVTAGDPQIVRLLAERGGYAGVNADAPFGIRALHQAAYDDKIEILRLLLESGADVNARTFKGWTALHCAARYGYLSACRILVDSGADEQAVTNKMKTPKMLAEQWKHPYLSNE